MDKSAQAEPAAFDPALSQYLIETLARERRRRLYKTSRVLAFLWPRCWPARYPSHAPTLRTRWELPIAPR